MENILEMTLLSSMLISIKESGAYSQSELIAFNFCY